MRKRILLIDDAPNLVAGLSRNLRAKSPQWEILGATNGREALRLAADAAVDLIVTDILMPDMDGLETIQAFHRDHPEARILAVSGGGKHVGVWPLSLAPSFGADATLEKPFSVDELMRIMVALLSEGRPRATARAPRGGGWDRAIMEEAGCKQTPAET